ncbi:Ribosome-associated heat shock protein implicated in the recycling of the 50S subunit (S4 paralog) [hydrothermal vent metagenome]|uniref:Ribosome-associated heat shock protein implicated in the recycling of the 50S subunit (S4 paralog) n=1 Tax=hydrothermal vent metagenome TaxID=652676 RepID=A0A3B0UPU6_9ZZZZ
MTVRIDKWLWSTRFYKTRSLAKKHVESGKVKLDGQKIKPSRAVNIDAELEIHKGDLIWKVKVLKLIDKRVSAKLAVDCYAEDTQSISARNDAILASKMIYSSTPRPARHPNKKDRRDLIKIKKNQYK